MKNYSRENRVFRYDVFSTNQMTVKKVRTVRTGFHDDAIDNLSGQPRISFFSCYLPGLGRELPNKSDVDAFRLAYGWKLQILRFHV